MADRAFPGKLSDSINDFYDAFQVGLDAGHGLPTFFGRAQLRRARYDALAR